MPSGKESHCRFCSMRIVWNDRGWDIGGNGSQESPWFTVKVPIGWKHWTPGEYDHAPEPAY